MKLIPDSAAKVSRRTYDTTNAITSGQLMIFAGGIYLDSGFRLFWAILALVTACVLAVMIWHFGKTLRFLKDTKPALVSDDM